MTFLQAIANYLCAHSGGTRYADVRGAERITPRLELARTCFVHEAPSDQRKPLVVVKWGPQDDALPQDDPRALQTVTFVVYANDWFDNDAIVAEITDIFDRAGRFESPSAAEPLYLARMESAPKLQPEGREEETQRCVALLNVRFQFVTIQ